MRISEIFKSINGEGKFAGYPSIFIRTHGCNISCSYCDSKYACLGHDYTTMSITDIMSEVEKLNCNRITLTGGEPLIQAHSFELVGRLLDRGYLVEIETNGAVDISDLTNVVANELCTITMDWKCPSSGMNSRMIASNLGNLRDTDVLKCVVGSMDDLDEMNRVRMLTSASVLVSPVFGKIDPKDIVKYLLDNDLNSVRFQLQIHKFIWPADMRGV